MKKFVLGAALAFLMVQPVVGFCGGDLDVFLSDLNVQARADLPGFKARLSVTFGVPVQQVEAVFISVQAPADAYMVLKVEQVAGRPGRSCSRSTSQQGQRMGCHCQEPRRKPGSREFHELRRDTTATLPEMAKEGRAKGRAREMCVDLTGGAP
jgi:hypothetical protein